MRGINSTVAFKTFLVSTTLLYSAAAVAQQAPATPVPPVTVQPPVQQAPVQQAPVQQAAPKPKPKPVAAKPKPAPAPVIAPPPEAADAGPQRDADGRVTTTARPSTTPVEASSILPKDTQNLTTAGTRVDSKQIEEQRPLTNHELLQRVPGVIVVNDDGQARHSGISIRGSNFRRSRKVLVQEDGQPINYSTYIDASTHYTPPTDRVENVEVLRGTVISHGPLNNHGVVNFQNLSPFGKPETVIKGSLSYTEGADDAIGNQRHFHTRQRAGNVGAVFSYTGSETPGAWDNETLRFNDLYGALGWRSSEQDLTISAMHFRGRDTYDEDNFVGTAAQFFANGRNKDGALAGTDDNTFNHNVTRLQIAHNYRFDRDTTLSSKLYGGNYDRNRFLNRTDPGDPLQFRSRERDYEHVGADTRLELANRPFLGGMTQDILAGVRVERHQLRDCTGVGPEGIVLSNKFKGNCTTIEDENASLDEYSARAFSAFLQTSIHLNRAFTVTPGVRFEHYNVRRNQVFQGVDPGDPPAELETNSQTFNEVLPGIGFAYNFAPLTTLYGGYHRGFAPNIVRDSDFPLTSELGDNFQVGVRSKAVKGLSFDVAYFHSFISDYQNKESFNNPTGDSVFGALDEVELKGFELAARLESRPFTGGAWNMFAEAAYTYTDGKIKRANDALFGSDPGNYVFEETNVSGNRLPFAINHFANLTLGVAYKNIWDASVTATYRGDFFTNSQNNTALICVNEDTGVVNDCSDRDPENELVGGKVDDVWLLSARTNLRVTDNLTLFMAGTNLTDELYIAELSDGAKPGQGRTILGGFTLKFD